MVNATWEGDELGEVHRAVRRASDRRSMGTAYKCSCALIMRRRARALTICPRVPRGAGTQSRSKVVQARAESDLVDKVVANFCVLSRIDGKTLPAWMLPAHAGICKVVQCNQKAAARWPSVTELTATIGRQHGETFKYPRNFETAKASEVCAHVGACEWYVM